MTKEEKKFIVRGFTRGLAVGAVAAGVGALFGAWVKDTFFSKADVPGSNTLSAPKNLPIGPDSEGSSGAPALPTTPEAPVSKPSAASLDSPHAQPKGQVDMSPHEYKPTHDAPPYPDISIKQPPETFVPPTSPSSTEAIPSGTESVKAPALTPEVPALENDTAYAKLSEIKKGEGIWHAVHRQLNYQMSHTSPEEFAKRYGLSVEDINAHPKQSVERITGKLLIDQNYIKPNGGGSEQLVKGKNTYQWRKPGGGAWTETRIAKPGVHVILGEDGKIEIADAGKVPANTPGARPNVANEALFADAQKDVPVKLEETPTAPSNINEALNNAERAMEKAEAAASKAEASLNTQKTAPNISPDTTKVSPLTPTGTGKTPIGVDGFGEKEGLDIGRESGLLADGSDGATTEEYKTLRGMGPADNEFRKGFAPDRAPATQILTDAQREAMQLDYQGLPEKGAGEIVGGVAENGKVSPMDPTGLGNRILEGSAVFPHPEAGMPPASTMGGVVDGTAETVKEITPLPEPVKHILGIGKRGPEGAIIDRFRTNPELAKQFGWDGKKNLNIWAGKEADTLYKAYQKQSLGNPTVVQEMERLGYKPTPKGHESMMHRIKSGTVELDPKTKSLTLKDINIIKAGDTMTLLSEAENTARHMAGIPLEKYVDVRDMSLVDFLKKPPRGKGFELLADVLHEAKPTKIDMQKGVGEYLTNRFGR